MEVHIGPEIIRSYKRLSYTAWHALAEFVDNSIQSSINNKEILDNSYAEVGHHLMVQISYGYANGGRLNIYDNAMGMSEEELSQALRIGRPPDITSGLSEFGMGLKTAACWFGDEWTIRTTKLGSTKGHSIRFEVEQVASGNPDLHYSSFKVSESEHYTEISISKLNHRFYGRAISTIKTFLASMYRAKISDRSLSLSFNGGDLQWVSPIENGNIHISEGEECLESFTFTVGGKEVHGWIAVMERGSRSDAGLTIIRRGRVIRGWPNSWRPQTMYGQYEGSNDLINQRLVGEINLDNFGVSHTKDEILYEGDEQESLEMFLADIAEPYMTIARSYRRRGTSGDFPTKSLVTSAMRILEEEILSPRFQAIVAANGDVPRERYESFDRSMIRVIRTDEPRGVYSMKDSTLSVFLTESLSERDPYVGIEIDSDHELNIVINLRHPHVRDLSGRKGVLNHLKSCTYEGIAQWKVEEAWNAQDPLLIRAIKDSLLRVGHSMDRETMS